MPVARKSGSHDFLGKVGVAGLINRSLAIRSQRNGTFLAHAYPLSLVLYTYHSRAVTSSVQSLSWLAQL